MPPGPPRGLITNPESLPGLLSSTAYLRCIIYWVNMYSFCLQSSVSCPSLTAPNNGMIDYTGNMSEDTCTFSSDPASKLYFVPEV